MPTDSVEYIRLDDGLGMFGNVSLILTKKLLKCSIVHIYFFDISPYIRDMSSTREVNERKIQRT